MLKIEPSLVKKIEQFQRPSPLIFGQSLSPVMAQCLYRGGRWQEPKLTAYAPLSIMPNAKVLHYGQEIFEGMKAYFVDKKGPFLFRPEENWKRFNASASRMAMPDVPRDIFMDTICSVTHHSKPLIPTESGGSLYLRPFMFTTEESLGINAPVEFIFMVIASPCEDYFTGGAFKLWVERLAVRACPGGVGTAKTGGNYAAAIKSTVEANARGLDQVLWIDAITRENVEELSGMNFFCLIEDVLYTPELTDSILGGITRKSILELAKTLSLEVREETIKIHRLLGQIEQKLCTEAFACGTAVVVTPIASLSDVNKTYPLLHSFGPVAKKIRSHLLDIQEGRVEDTRGWCYRVKS